MKYRHLGRSGLKVSALSFGAWVTFGDQIDEDVARACMRAAREAGVNFFDNAEAYAHGQAEKMMGKIIRQEGWRRSDLVLSTKIFWGGPGPNDQGLSRKHLIEGTEAALERLQTDYVDLVFCHRPDPETPIEETVRAMSFLIDQHRHHRRLPARAGRGEHAGARRGRAAYARGAGAHRGHPGQPPEATPQLPRELRGPTTCQIAAQAFV